LSSDKSSEIGRHPWALSFLRGEAGDGTKRIVGKKGTSKRRVVKLADALKGEGTLPPSEKRWVRKRTTKRSRT